MPSTIIAAAAMRERVPLWLGIGLPGLGVGALAALLSACGHLPIAEPAFEAMSDKRAGIPTDWTVRQMTGDTAARFGACFSSHALVLLPNSSRKPKRVIRLRSLTPA